MIIFIKTLLKPSNPCFHVLGMATVPNYSFQGNEKCNSRYKIKNKLEPVLWIFRYVSAHVLQIFASETVNY